MDRPLKAIITDFDDTLYAFEPCDTLGYKTVFAYLTNRFGRSDTLLADTLTKVKHDLKQSIPNQAASHARVLYFQRLMEALTGRSEPDTVGTLEEIFRDAYVDAMELFPGVRERLTAIRAQGITIGMLTDLTTSVQLKKLRALGISDLIDLLVSSEEAGAEKPDPKPYTLMLSKLGCEPDEVCMIGDSLSKDMMGAKSIGITRLRRKQTPETRKPSPDPLIQTFEDFSQISL